MFGALNRFISRLDSDSPSPSNSGYGAFGFQVLRNTDPKLPIEPWFDFIIGINGRQIDDADPNLFTQEVRNCAGNSVTFGIWSAKGQRLRTLSIPVSSSAPSLQLTLQWTPLSTTEDVWHILDVAANSPADTAGLLPYGDYIIGTPEGLVRGEAGLGELVEDHAGRPLDLFVYNHEHNSTRPLTITPSRSWGGAGLLGCVLGYGALHRLPAPLDEPPQAPGETLFETARLSNDYDPDRAATAAKSSPAAAPLLSAPPFSSSSSSPSSEFLVPAAQLAGATELRTSSTSTLKPREKTRGARPVGGTSPSRAMDDYFREGEEKSREEDHAPSGNTNKAGRHLSPPPPPKAGSGPPPPPPKPKATKVDETESSTPVA
ncbi:MAG: hypothetical protein M1825_001714 [Sarcosagium campestre]|nr:MAG: hypothetical protein M1825_001714 [Sarcosagium campestre]